MSNSILGNEVTKGKIINFNGKLYRVISSQSVKPGKGGTYNQVVMKDIYNNTKMETRFRSDENVDLVQVFKEKGFFVNFDDMDACFINSETLDSFMIEKTAIENYEFLEENLEVDLLARYLERLLLGEKAAQSSAKQDISLEFLAKHGFLR
mgnify:CR=1 FL=1